MRYRKHLPQLDGGSLFLTDGGIETTLIFHRGLDLPAFAAFDLLKDGEGTDALRRYYAPSVALARARTRSASCSRVPPGAPVTAGPPTPATPRPRSTS